MARAEPRLGKGSLHQFWNDSLLGRWDTGAYVVMPGTWVVNASCTLVLNTLYALPIYVPRTMTFDRLGVRVNTGAVGASARIGIYGITETQYPGALILDAGAVAVATDGTDVEATISQQLTRGYYWVGIVSDGGPVVEGDRRVWGPLGLNAHTNPQPLWSVAFTYGALPDPFTAGGAKGALNSSCPRVALRLLTTDD